MKSKLLKRAGSFQDVAKKYDATVVGEDTVSLNDELVHLGLVVSDKGQIPALIIKNLHDEKDNGVVIERNFIPDFIDRIRDAFIQVRLMEQDLKS